MEDESLLKRLSAETRAKLRSTQILTSLPSIVSELLQNAIDAGASQIDIGVDCAEWSCWVLDNGSGFSKDGLYKIGQDSENGRYNSSKACGPASIEAVSTFGFRGEALASMADLSCLEISSRTERSQESWSIIVKAGKTLYTGPSIRWRREYPGTVVSIRDAFFSLPIRRQSHPAPNKTIELIRQELEAYALVFPNLSLSLHDVSKTKECINPHKSHLLKIPKTRSTLAAFRHFYGRAFTEESLFLHCVEEIAATSGQLHIEGFISLVGAHTKSYQFLYINKHPISFCDLHRLIDTRFSASTFAKHAYDEGGETSLRPTARRSPRKGEMKPVYVLNLIIPVKHIDNCLEPSKSAVELDNKNVVTSFLSTTIQSFLVRHNFAPDNRSGEDPEGGSSKKKRRFASDNLKTPSSSVQPERNGTPEVAVHVGNIPVADAQKTIWKDPSTGESFVIDSRTGNSYPQYAHFTVGTDGPIETGPKRRTLRATQQTTGENAGRDHAPDWLREALQANAAFALKEPKIRSLSLVTNQDTDYRSSDTCHSCCRTSCLTERTISNCYLQPGSSGFGVSQIRFQKDDLRKARIISQVDFKFIACVIGLDQDDPYGKQKVESCKDGPPAHAKTLVLVDQHAADERVRVERFLESICRGFLGYHEGSGGVETKRLSPPVPVLLTKHEARRLAELSDFQKAFESWGFRFTGIDQIQSEPGCEIDVNGGYTQVFVSSIPEIVSEKLLSGKELQELIKGYIGALENGEFEPRDPCQHGPASTDEETKWLKALRWCPRELLDLVNSKACRGAIMFNDPLNMEQCERLIKQLSTTVFPFQCAHGRPSLVPLTRLDARSGGRKELEWENLVRSCDVKPN